jgi:hypothetical protein
MPHQIAVSSDCRDLYVAEYTPDRLLHYAHGDEITECSVRSEMLAPSVLAKQPCEVIHGVMCAPTAAPTAAAVSFERRVVVESGDDDAARVGGMLRRRAPSAAVGVLRRRDPSA